MKIRVHVMLAITAALPAAGWTAPSAVTPTGFLVTVDRDVSATPPRVWQALGQIASWWSSDHTWSGSAANLSLQLKAGGCFCEQWQENSVEHGRVINATKDQLLRLLAPLGPLQALPVNAVLTFELSAQKDATHLHVTYAVAGGGADFTQLAAPVDAVISEQVDRLVRYAQK